MKKSLALVLILAACGLTEETFQISGPFKPGSLKLYLAQDTPGAGLTKATVAGSDNVIYLHPNPELTEAHLKKVAVWDGQYDDKTIVLMFNDDGTARMARVTAENINKRLAFVIDDKIIMAPVIQTQITEGQAVIEGGYTKQEAEDLAKRLSGS